MKLRRISEAIKGSGLTTVYKAFSPEGFEAFKRHGIPGFIGELELALIYAEPALTGTETDTRILVEFTFDLDTVEDLSNEISDMCVGDWKNSVYKDRIWTAPGSGHGGKMGFYCGQPVDDWRVAAIFRGESEWLLAYNKFKATGNL